MSILLTLKAVNVKPSEKTPELVLAKVYTGPAYGVIKTLDTGSKSNFLMQFPGMVQCKDAKYLMIHGSFKGSSNASQKKHYVTSDDTSDEILPKKKRLVRNLEVSSEKINSASLPEISRKRHRMEEENIPRKRQKIEQEPSAATQPQAPEPQEVSFLAEDGTRLSAMRNFQRNHHITSSGGFSSITISRAVFFRSDEYYSINKKKIGPLAQTINIEFIVEKLNAIQGFCENNINLATPNFFLFSVSFGMGIGYIFVYSVNLKLKKKTKISNILLSMRLGDFLIFFMDMLG